MNLDIEASPILTRAISRGGQLAELYLEETATLSIIMDDKRVEKLIAGVDAGAGLRLIHDLRTAYAHANQISEATLLDMAGNLAAMAGGQAGEVAAIQALHPGLVPEIKTPPATVETARKVEMVRAAEAVARDMDSRIRQVRVTYGERMQQVRIVNSLGQEARERRTYVLLAVHCVAEDGGVKQTGYETAGGLLGMELFEETSPEEVAKIAAGRALMMLSALPAPGGSMPVVLHSKAGGTMIHEAVGHGLEADHVLEGMSVYGGLVDQEVASPLISVVDDGTIPTRRGSFGFDDEGVPSRRNLLIDKGVLKGYLHDRLSALKMDAEPTGNGRRENYQARPVPRMTNTMILSGADDPESIISDTPEGLLVTKMGGGQVNPVNGDFVFEVAEGFLIKDGRQGDPVRGATLTGNGPKVLKDIDRVGSDLGFGIGTCGKDGQGVPVADAQPTLRIPRLVVGGVQGE